MLEFDGTKLKRIRRERGLTQGELGQLVGKKTEHISNYENQHANPPAHILLSLIDVLKISPQDLSKETEAV